MNNNKIEKNEESSILLIRRLILKKVSCFLNSFKKLHNYFVLENKQEWTSVKLKEVIVVEGRDDTVAIKRAVDADTIETNGSAIGEQVIAQIELAQKRRGVIILTDPDYPGERIRNIVSQRVPGCKHAFLPKKDALSKNGDDLGVENASPEAIRSALNSAKKETVQITEEITWQDLHAAGLIGGTSAKNRRERLGLMLRIGYCNGKQLYNRLLKFQISKEEFANAMRVIIEEEGGQ